MHAHTEASNSDAQIPPRPSSHFLSAPRSFATTASKGYSTSTRGPPDRVDRDAVTPHLLVPSSTEAGRRTCHLHYRSDLYAVRYTPDSTVPRCAPRLLPFSNSCLQA